MHVGHNQRSVGETVKQIDVAQLASPARVATAELTTDNLVAHAVHTRIRQTVISFNLAMRAVEANLAMAEARISVAVASVGTRSTSAADQVASRASVVAQTDALWQAKFAKSDLAALRVETVACSAQMCFRIGCLATSARVAREADASERLVGRRQVGKR